METLSLGGLVNSSLKVHLSMYQSSTVQTVTKVLRFLQLVSTQLRILLPTLQKLEQFLEKRTGMLVQVHRLRDISSLICSPPTLMRQNTGYLGLMSKEIRH
jgi:hypothetical protein